MKTSAEPGECSRLEALGKSAPPRPQQERDKPVRGCLEREGLRQSDRGAAGWLLGRHAVASGEFACAGLQCFFFTWLLMVIVVLKTVLVDSVIASFTLRVWLLASSRLPTALSETVTVLLWPAPSVTVVVPTTTTFFFSFAVAATAITLPRLIVSFTVNVSPTGQVAPAGPVQLRRILTLVPLVEVPLMVAAPTPPLGIAGGPGAPELPAGDACTTAVCGDSTVAPSPFAFDASSNARIVEPTSAEVRV